MASAFYNIALENFLTSGSYINLASDTIRVRPVRVSGYTFAATHTSMTPVVAATGGPGDGTLGTKVIKTGTDGGCFDAADQVFTGWAAGAAIDALVIFKFVTNDAASTPICYLDGFSVTPNGGDITFQWAAANPFIFKI
jgi:hypothetical protein